MILVFWNFNVFMRFLRNYDYSIRRTANIFRRKYFLYLKR